METHISFDGTPSQFRVVARETWRLTGLPIGDSIIPDYVELHPDASLVIVCLGKYDWASCDFAHPYDGYIRATCAPKGKANRVSGRLGSHVREWN